MRCCIRCGTSLPDNAAYCSECGRAIGEAQLNTAAGTGTLTRPWYRWPFVLFMAFAICLPLWGILIATDRQQRKGNRIAAGVLGLLSVLGLAALLSVQWEAPRIEFGSDYAERDNSVVVVGRKARFTPGEPFAWVAYLGGPADSSRVDVAFSEVTPGGGERVLQRSPLDLANPEFSVIFGRSPALLLRDPGTYRLRVFRGDQVLAVGQFEIGSGPERELRSEPKDSTQETVELTIGGARKAVHPDSWDRAFIYVDVTVTRQNGGVDAMATMSDLNFKLVGPDGAVYRPAWGWRATSHPCASEMGVPTSGSRSCTVIFDVEKNVMSGQVWWGRLTSVLVQRELESQSCPK